VDVDRAQGLHSIVTRFGVRGAFVGARISHVATVLCLVGVGLGLTVGVLYWIGVAVVAALLGYEHSLVRPTISLSRRPFLMERRDQRCIRGVRDRRRRHLRIPTGAGCGLRARRNVCPQRFCGDSS
jgi:hypothetical protein